MVDHVLDFEEENITHNLPKTMFVDVNGTNYTCSQMLMY